MLRLENVEKIYKGGKGGEPVAALRGVTLEFRDSEFVSILGPSGCGKTTLLNIIGGLDKYDGGNLTINGTPTKNFKDDDWDAYRCHSVGFVFQNYNLISHQTVLQNVELAMTLSGVSSAQRKRRAVQALADVGLGRKLGKTPNQLSGGEMQRVAIARALVNNPDIVLADEPTGSLDSKTSMQIMEILKEVSKTRLVIMVTHNPELAERYSTRTVRLLDGALQSDDKPFAQEEKDAPPKRPAAKGFGKTSMSMRAAMALSFKNLLTKKGRTVTTAIAGSIGIVGVGLVLALTGGIGAYMSGLEVETAAGFPLVIPPSVPGALLGADVSSGRLDAFVNQGNGRFPMFPDDGVIHRHEEIDEDSHYNVLSDEFLAHIANIDAALPGMVTAVSFGRELNMNVLSNAGGNVVRFSTANESDLPIFAVGAAETHWQELPDSRDFVLDHFDLIAGRMPESKNEIVLVVDQQNRIESGFFANLGIPQDGRSFAVNDFLNQTLLKVIDNNYYFQQAGELFAPASPGVYRYLFENAGGVPLTIVGILRSSADPDGNIFGTMFIFNEGFAHTSALTEHVLAQAADSDIVIAQQNSDVNVFTGAPFVDGDERDEVFANIGANAGPASVSIFAADFDAKGQIQAYISGFNAGRPESEHIIAIDVAEILVLSMLGGMFSVLPPVLIGFAAIALVVSTIMIGIITYVSVMERTKEIGILRSVGARKKDISRVFTAETLIIGLAAGALGVAATYILTIPLGILFESLSGLSGIVSLNPAHALLLIAGSMALTMAAGFFPSQTAAEKDPVEALRTE